MNVLSKIFSRRQRYTVVLRCAESQLRLPAGKGLRLAPITSEYGDFELRVLTRTDQVRDIQTPIPRELWIEVTGPAPSLEVAVNISAATAVDYLRQVAFGANAWHGLLNVHLAFDSTPGRRTREFFQNWVVDERGLPRTARIIDPDLMFRLLGAITQLSKKDKPRLIRAIRQYTDSLQHWKLGNELYALAHLYMGVEAITPTAIRWELARRGLRDRKALELTVLDPTPSTPAPLLRVAGFFYRLAGGYIPAQNLDTWARREIIFRGDFETFKTAREASDKLEHGLAQHDEVHRLASQCVEKCAAYLRDAILDFIPLSAEDRTTLRNKPYAKPAKTGGFERQLLATITCKESEIAAPDQAYPYVRWELDLKDFRVTEDGAHEMQVTQKITPVIGAKAKMQMSKIHFAGPSETKHRDIEVSIEPKLPNISTAGIEISVDDPEDTKWVRPVGSMILNCNAVRNMSMHWIQKLMGQPADQVAQLSFRDAVEKIKDILSQLNVPKQLQIDCVSAWSEALELDEIRIAIAGCATQPKGLMNVDHLAHGKAPFLSDFGKLLELNDKVVGLAKKLSSLLDELMNALTCSNKNKG